jgi:hypothetical protein
MSLWSAAAILQPSLLQRESAGNDQAALLFSEATAIQVTRGHV